MQLKHIHETHMNRMQDFIMDENLSFYFYIIDMFC
jgi:hypothetical protein